MSNSSNNNADVLTSAFGPRDKNEAAGFEYDFHGYTCSYCQSRVVELV